jgi:speckle-type POZ protein
VDLCRESDSRTAAVAAEHDLASHTIIVPPPNMSQQMLQLLESKVGADVTFHVEHREFQAHKILLAMRSPVFRAEFFGSMTEAATRCVRILDMKADAFETVLRFVYATGRPRSSRHRLQRCCGGQGQAHGEGARAADRFGLERVRLMCEKALCEAMDGENAAAALRLADRHHCQKLKAFCIHYISSTPGALKNVMATEAFQELKESRPSILTELLHKLATKATCP